MQAAQFRIGRSFFPYFHKEIKQLTRPAAALGGIAADEVAGLGLMQQAALVGDRKGLQEFRPFVRLIGGQRTQAERAGQALRQL